LHEVWAGVHGLIVRQGGEIIGKNLESADWQFGEFASWRVREFAVSHPFRKKREKDGAPGLARLTASIVRRRDSPFG
jgi:hypothetical protein